MKIGFIDYYLDEWHANNYPAWIKEHSGGEITVDYAWGKIPSPLTNVTTDDWCEKYGVKQCRTIEEVIEKSDALVVLSPDNCEMHEDLCALPLRSGKRVYVDKTFAPDAASARRIFTVAEEYGTPCWSASALRYAEEYSVINPDDVRSVSLWGPNGYDNYAIHQLEPLMMLMNGHPIRVMTAGSESDLLNILVEFEDGRVATASLFRNGSPFITNVAMDAPRENRLLEIKSDYFSAFIDQLVDFFFTGEEKVPHAETIEIMAVREAGLKAMKSPRSWIRLDSLQR